MPIIDKDFFLQEQGFKNKNIEEIALKDIGSRKKIECLIAKSKEDEIAIFFISLGKSRILKNEFDILETLKKAVEELKNVSAQKKIYFHTAPICSKALRYAEELGWSVIHVSL